MIPPYEYRTALKRVEIRIDEKVYDVTHWRNKHPGGVELLDKFHNSDATDVFYALHSDEAINRLKHMRSVSATETTIPRDEIAAKFHEWRETLVANGWTKRNWFLDFIFILPCASLGIIGTYVALSCQFAYSHLVATLVIGLGMQQAGWMAHDYCHGRGKASYVIGNLFGGLYNGLSPLWWAHKHNTHHAFPNRIDYDTDIHNEPIVHLRFPTKEGDCWFRKYQHYYYLPVYAFLYAGWRWSSILFVVGSKNWFERTMIVLNYVWLACLPWKVAVGSILVGGWLVAVIVTANHTAEPKLTQEDKYNYCHDQFLTTRGVHCSNWFTEYLFGGMQYQLEHHMFPTMPKYYYPALRPLMKEFAEKHGLPFKVSGVWEVLKLNYDTMKTWAGEIDEASYLHSSSKKIN